VVFFCSQTLRKPAVKSRTIDIFSIKKYNIFVFFCFGYTIIVCKETKIKTGGLTMTHSLTVPALLKGANIIELPDTATHRFRFDIPSESSNNLYRISQRITNGSTHGQYECSCKSWIYRRGGDGTGLCKHLKTFKPALDNLVAQADALASGSKTALPAPATKATKAKASKTTPALSAPKTTPSKGLLDDIDDFEQVAPAKATLSIKKGEITLNAVTQKKVGDSVQLLYSASKGVIVLKPIASDDSFDVDNGVIDATDFLANVGKIKSGDLELESISLKDGSTGYAVSIK
jgi:hypothetical protein